MDKFSVHKSKPSRTTGHPGDRFDNTKTCPRCSYREKYHSSPPQSLSLRCICSGSSFHLPITSEGGTYFDNTATDGSVRRREMSSTFANGGRGLHPGQSNSTMNSVHGHAASGLLSLTPFSSNPLDSWRESSPGQSGTLSPNPNCVASSFPQPKGDFPLRIEDILSPLSTKPSSSFWDGSSSGLRSVASGGLSVSASASQKALVRESSGLDRLGFADGMYSPSGGQEPYDDQSWQDAHMMRMLRTHSSEPLQLANLLSNASGNSSGNLSARENSGLKRTESTNRELGYLGHGNGLTKSTSNDRMSMGGTPTSFMTAQNSCGLSTSSDRMSIAGTPTKILGVDSSTYSGKDGNMLTSNGSSRMKYKDVMQDGSQVPRGISDTNPWGRTSTNESFPSIHNLSSDYFSSSSEPTPRLINGISRADSREMFAMTLQDLLQYTTSSESNSYYEGSSRLPSSSSMENTRGYDSMRHGGGSSSSTPTSYENGNGRSSAFESQHIFDRQRVTSNNSGSLPLNGYGDGIRMASKRPPGGESSSSSHGQTRGSNRDDNALGMKSMESQLNKQGSGSPSSSSPSFRRNS